jgi:hypothetical protein
MESTRPLRGWPAVLIRLHCLALAAALAGCGGPRPAVSANDVEEEDEDEEIEEEAEDEEEDEEGNERFVDSALLRQANEPIELGEPVELPGTGVTMRAPASAQPLPFGSGFMSMRDRIQVSVVVVVGTAELLDTVRTGGSPNAPEPQDVEEIEVAGAQGRVGRDRIRTPQGELERGWLLVHDGTRGLAVMGTYEAARSRVAWSMLRESFSSLAWDRTATLDAAAALGIEVGSVDGLTVSPSTTANVVMLGRGATYPPQPGQPVVMISPLPLQLASEQSASACAQLVARLLPVPASDVSLEGAIENGGLPGCERLATAEAEGRRMATYTAILFSERTPILVTGSVDAAQVARWRARFTSAARAVRPRS